MLSIGKGVEQLFDIKIIFGFFFALIVEKSLGIGNHKPNIMFFKIVFHLFVLGKAPLEEIRFHVFDDDVAGEGSRLELAKRVGR